MKKKGQVIQSKVITIVLIIIAAAVLIGFAVYFYVIQKGQTDKQICYNTVVARNNALTKGGSVIPIEMVPLKCKTQNIVIESPEKTEIEKTIANAMYDCWDMLGQGKIDFFKPDSWITKLVGTGEEKSNCVLCSTIVFKENIKDKNTILEMNKYLAETNIPDKDMKYIDFFTDSNNEKFELIQDSGIEGGDMRTGEDYAIMYIAVKNPKLNTVLAQRGIPGAIAGMIVGGLVAGPPGALVGAVVVSTTQIDLGAIGLIKTSRNLVMYCGDNQDDCRFMTVTPLNEKISSLCNNFASIP